MNSANEAGGIAPAPLQVTAPEPQSAVVQENFPEASVEQPVRPQNRPDHGAFVDKELVAPEVSSNPVEDSWVLPDPASVPGQTVYGQLFLNEKVSARVPASANEKVRYNRLLTNFILSSFHENENKNNLQSRMEE